jgi:hypothetical protein
MLYDSSRHVVHNVPRVTWVFASCECRSKLSHGFLSCFVVVICLAHFFFTTRSPSLAAPWNWLSFGPSLTQVCRYPTRVLLVWRCVWHFSFGSSLTQVCRYPICVLLVWQRVWHIIWVSCPTQVWPLQMLQRWDTRSWESSQCTDVTKPDG